MSRASMLKVCAPSYHLGQGQYVSLPAHAPEALGSARPTRRYPLLKLKYAWPEANADQAFFAKLDTISDRRICLLIGGVL